MTYWAAPWLYNHHLYIFLPFSTRNMISEGHQQHANENCYFLSYRTSREGCSCAHRERLSGNDTNRQVDRYYPKFLHFERRLGRMEMNSCTCCTTNFNILEGHRDARWASDHTYGGDWIILCMRYPRRFGPTTETRSPRDNPQITFKL